MINPVVHRVSGGIGAKLLLVVLPCMLLGAVAMFMLFEQYSTRDRVSALRARLDSFAVTQAASLVKPLWEFDSATVDRLFRSMPMSPNCSAPRSSMPMELPSPRWRGTRPMVIGRSSAEWCRWFSKPRGETIPSAGWRLRFMMDGCRAN